MHLNYTSCNLALSLSLSLIHLFSFSFPLPSFRLFSLFCDVPLVLSYTALTISERQQLIVLTMSHYNNKSHHSMNDIRHVSQSPVRRLIKMFHFIKIYVANSIINVHCSLILQLLQHFHYLWCLVHCNIIYLYCSTFNWRHLNIYGRIFSFLLQCVLGHKVWHSNITQH